MDSKNLLQSKTAWLGIVMAVTAFIPSVQEFIKNHIEEVNGLIGVLLLVFRYFTSGDVHVIPKKEENGETPK